MANHAARDHAQWSASATERNWNCPGALALTDDLPETTSEAADWGTCCHQISEKCLREGTQAVEYLGTIERGKKYEFEVDDEMAETAQTYVDFVRRTVIEAAPAKVNPASLLKIEQHFSLAKLGPPFEAGGTADAVIYAPEQKLLHVIDLKGGRGHVVEVVGNPQLRTYALGAMLANADLAVEKVRVTIVQPRAPHKDGRIRSDEFHVADLIEWTSDLLEAMDRSAQAAADRLKIGQTVSRAEWESTHLRAGTHCKFCKAEGFCPALKQKALDVVGVWFDDLDQPRISNSPDAMSPETLAQTLDMLDMIGDWANAVRNYAQALAEGGATVPGYQLVDKFGNRAWVEGLDPGLLELALTTAGKDEGAAYAAPKLLTPAQFEKVLGAKHKHLIEKLIVKPHRGVTLVSTAKTTKPAAGSAADRFFDNSAN